MHNTDYLPDLMLASHIRLSVEFDITESTFKCFSLLKNATALNAPLNQNCLPGAIYKIAVTPHYWYRKQLTATGAKQPIKVLWYA
jgi:hypothetical protein